MVATGQPLAAQAGLEILKKGGNAIDAAIATAACLTVVEPTGNGIGGDSFSLVWSGGKLHGLNASGFSPASADASELLSKGLKEVPQLGWYTVTVPGAPSAWAELSEKFGKLPLAEVMSPAVSYAERGFAVSPTVAKLWSMAFKRFAAALGVDTFKNWAGVFCPKGRAPFPGEIWSSAEQARTLRMIADSGAEEFYRGEIAGRIETYSKQYGGWITASDLADFYPEWVAPISVNYRGYDIWEIPPNGHGINALMALNIIGGFDFSGSRERTEIYHLSIEAMKLAFIDGMKYVADPRFMEVKVSDLLSSAFASERRTMIGENALDPTPGKPHGGGTVYLATADEEGNMVSMIQSNYNGFGSGLVVPGTGIGLHNRGNNFSLDHESPNFMAPRKKPYHTIIPGFITKEGSPVGPFGIMGAFMQPQAHVQVVTNMIDFGMNPQEAIDAPRWQWIEGRSVELEQSVENHIALGLAERGHNVKLVSDNILFGRGEMIVRTQYGTLAGATEPRTDGNIAVW
jgi:gamma-glutamyltranspeptidase/glutathione hydrolase